MRNVVAIMQRELGSLFYSPIGYTVICGFLLLTGVIMAGLGNFGPGKPATLRSIFEFTPYVLAFLVPAITMRSISEEYRSGTIESLMTAPITDAQMVLGKFIAAVCFYAIMLGATLIYLIVLWKYGNPDIGASLTAYLGLLLAGVAFVGFGIFASSLTRNQIVAWMIGAIPLVLFVWFAAWLVQKSEGTSREILQRVNILRHLDQFNRGLIGVESVVFFLGVAAVFVFLAVKVVESKRWR